MAKTSKTTRVKGSKTVREVIVEAHHRATMQRTADEESQMVVYKSQALKTLKTRYSDLAVLSAERKETGFFGIADTKYELRRQGLHSLL